jgi:hypothetical protein
LKNFVLKVEQMDQTIFSSIPILDNNITLPSFCFWLDENCLQRGKKKEGDDSDWFSNELSENTIEADCERPDNSFPLESFSYTSNFASVEDRPLPASARWLGLLSCTSEMEQRNLQCPLPDVGCNDSCSVCFLFLAVCEERRMSPGPKPSRLPCPGAPMNQKVVIK